MYLSTCDEILFNEFRLTDVVIVESGSESRFTEKIQWNFINLFIKNAQKPVKALRRQVRRRPSFRSFENFSITFNIKAKIKHEIGATKPVIQKNANFWILYFCSKFQTRVFNKLKNPEGFSTGRDWDAFMIENIYSFLYIVWRWNS